MTNLHRGEIEAVIDGETRTLCLTLGALAELEARLGISDYSQLLARITRGEATARELLEVLRAGLIGGGHSISDDDLARLSVEGGLPGAARLVADVLIATFAEPAT